MLNTLFSAVSGALTYAREELLDDMQEGLAFIGEIDAAGGLHKSVDRAASYYESAEEITVRSDIGNTL